MSDSKREMPMIGIVLMTLLGLGYVGTRPGEGTPSRPAVEATAQPAEASASEDSSGLDRTTLAPYLAFVRPNAEVRPRDAKQLMAQEPFLKVVLATVPDPAHADLRYDFDQQIRSIQDAYHDMGWSLAGHWIPEQEEGRRGAVKRSVGEGDNSHCGCSASHSVPAKAPALGIKDVPRSLLFVRPIAPPIVRYLKGQGQLSSASSPWIQGYDKRLVLLLPESPAMGLRRGPLLRAVKFANDLQEAVSQQEYRYKNPLEGLETALEELLSDAGFALKEQVDLLVAEFERRKAMSPELKALLDGKILTSCNEEETPQRLDAMKKGLRDLPAYADWFSRLENLERDLAEFARLAQGARKAIPEAIRENSHSSRHRPLPSSERLVRLSEDLWSLVRAAQAHRRSCLQVLGPRYSGSAQDLAFTLRERLGPQRYALVLSVGSTLPDLRENVYQAKGGMISRRANIWPKLVTFYSLLPSDDAYGRVFRAWVEMRFHHSYKDAWCEFLESDTLFGGLEPWRPEHKKTDKIAQAFKVPANLFLLRQARDQGDGVKAPEGSLQATLAKVGFLDLRSESRDASAGLRPLDPNTPVDMDLTLRNQFEEVRQRGFQGIRVRMSSLQNTLFLARQIRTQLPDRLLAVDWTSQLFQHPELASDLDRAYLVGPLPPRPWALGLDMGDTQKSGYFRGYLEENKALTRDALWLLEHMVPVDEQGKLNEKPEEYACAHRWSLDTPKLSTKFLQWEGNGTTVHLRRQVWITQLSHGQPEVVHAALEPEDANAWMEAPLELQMPSMPSVPPPPGLRPREPLAREGTWERLLHPFALLGTLVLALSYTCLRRLTGSNSDSREVRYSLPALALTGLLFFVLPLQLLPPLASELVLLAGSGPSAAWLLALLQLTLVVGSGWVLCRTAWNLATRVPSPSAWLRVALPASLGWIAAVALAVWWGCRGFRLLGTSGDLSAFFSLLGVHRPFSSPAWNAFFLASLLLAEVVRGLECMAFQADRARSHPFFQWALPAFPPLDPGLAWLNQLREETLHPFLRHLDWRQGLLLALGFVLVLGLLEHGGMQHLTRPWGMPPGYSGEILLVATSAALLLGLWMAYRAVRLWRRLERATAILMRAPWKGAYPFVGKVYQWRVRMGMNTFAEEQPFHGQEAFYTLLQRSLRHELSPLHAQRVQRFGDLIKKTRLVCAQGGVLGRDSTDRHPKEIGLLRSTDAAAQDIIDRLPAGKCHMWGQEILALCTYMLFKRVLSQVRHAMSMALVLLFLLVLMGGLCLQGTQLSAAFFLIFALVVTLVLFLVVRLERNPLFSKVAGGTENKVDWSWDFASGLAKPLGALLIGLLLTRFPHLVGLLQSALP